MFEKTKLRPYQHRMIKRAYEGNVGFFVDMGLGKTISALTAIDEMLRTGWRSALVVAPLRVCQAVWSQEAQDWAHTRKLRVVWVHGSAKQRLRLLAQPADVYLLSYSLLQWLGEQKTLDLPEILVLDESTHIKAPNTQRFKALRYRLLKRFERVIIMTGTPAPNTLLNLWSQVFCLDQGARLGTSYGTYKQRFFEQVDYQGYRYEPRRGAEEEIYDLLSDIVVRLDARDWLKLPEVIEAPTPVVLPDVTMRLYRKHEREMFTELDNEGTINSVNAAVLSMHCQQMANGAIYDDPEVRDSWSLLHNAKLDAVAELLEEDDSPVIIAYKFRHDLARLQAAYPTAVHVTKDNVAKVQEDWNADKLPIILMNPSSSSHGLNLQKGSGHRVIWLSLTWSLEHYTQTMGRLARSGSRHRRVYSQIIYARGTVDEAIMDALAHKAGTQRALLDALRRYRTRKTT